LTWFTGRTAQEIYHAPERLLPERFRSCRAAKDRAEEFVLLIAAGTDILPFFVAPPKYRSIDDD
jgi:hypothetical protein